MTAVNNFLLFIALHFAYVYCRIQHDLSVKRVDQRLIEKSRQNTLDMCRMFTAENNHLPSPNHIAPNREPATRHNHTVIHKKRVKRDIFATVGLRFDEARRVESIVDNLYDEVTEHGAPVKYRTKRLETTTTKKRNRNKPSRRFNFAPALLDYVPGHEDNPQKHEAPGASAGFPWPKKWKHGIVPYFIDSKTYDDALSENIIKAFDYIEKATCIRMQRLREKPVDQESMKKVEWLYISNPSGIRQCVHTNEKKKNKGVQLVIFGYDCLRNGDILHEVMHILGFSHEHTRPDRNEHLSILWDNIKPGYKRYFEVRSEDLLMNLPYDYTSVLHYPPRAFSKNGQLTILSESGVKIGQRDGLSETDVEKVGLVYGFECVERNRQYLMSTCPRVVKSNDKSEPNVTKEEITSYFDKRIWSYGIVNFKLKNLAEFSIEERENIKSVIRHIEKETCIEFRDLTEYTNSAVSSATGNKEEYPTTTIESNNFVNKDTDDNGAFTGGNKGISSEAKVPSSDKPSTGNKGISSEVKVTLENTPSKDDVLEEKLLDSRSKENFFKENMFSEKNINNQDSNTGYNNVSPGNTNANDAHYSKENKGISSEVKVPTPEKPITGGNKGISSEVKVTLENTPSKDDVLDGEVLGSRSKENFFKENMFSDNSIINQESNTEYNNLPPGNTKANDAHSKENKGISPEVKVPTPENPLTVGNKGISAEVKVTLENTPSKDVVLEGELLESRSKENFFKENMFSDNSIINQESTVVAQQSREEKGEAQTMLPTDPNIQSLTEKNNVAQQSREEKGEAQTMLPTDPNIQSLTEKNNVAQQSREEKGEAQTMLPTDPNIQSLTEKMIVAQQSREEKGEAQTMLPEKTHFKENFFKENMFSGEKNLADNKESRTETKVVSHENTGNVDAPKMLRKEKEDVLKGELNSHFIQNIFRDNMFSEKMLAAGGKEILRQKKVVSVGRRQNAGNHNEPTKKKQVSSNIPAKKTYRSKRSVLSPSRRHAQDVLILERSAHLGCKCPTPGRPSGAKVLKINTECFNSVNDLLHLFVHVLGLDHQHNMHDRDSYLHVAWDKLTPEIKEEMKDKLPPAASVGFPYDYQSVMHYPWLQIKNGVTNIMYPIWNDGWAMGHWQGLSSTDVSKLKLLYADQCTNRRRQAKKP